MDLLNPFGLDATGLLVWGTAAHAIADWPLQNDWMALWKPHRRIHHRKLPDPLPPAYDPDSPHYDAGARLRWGTGSPGPWWDRHPAAFAHAGVHLAFLLPVFGLVAVAIALVHLVIDTRVPVVWWSRLVGQTQPRGDKYISADAMATGYPHGDRPYRMEFDDLTIPLVDVPDKRLASPGEVKAAELETRLDRLERDLREWTAPAYDIGTEVRFWTDQVFHLATLAVFALAVGALS